MYVVTLLISNSPIIIKFKHLKGGYMFRIQISNSINDMCLTLYSFSFNPKICLIAKSQTNEYCLLQIFRNIAKIYRLNFVQWYNIYPCIQILMLRRQKKKEKSEVDVHLIKYRHIRMYTSFHHLPILGCSLQTKRHIREKLSSQGKTKRKV